MSANVVNKLSYTWGPPGQWSEFVTQIFKHGETSHGQLEAKELAR
jgi:hypothetical protein